LQYTIIAEPAKQCWYPMWRDNDQEVWNHFFSAGGIVSCPTLPEAQAYIDTWKRTFPILVISRAYLNAIGLSVAQVNSLTDEEMERIADILIAHHFDSEFDEDVVFTARLVLAGKRKQ